MDNTKTPKILKSTPRRVDTEGEERVKGRRRELVIMGEDCGGENSWEECVMYMKKERRLRRGGERAFTDPSQSKGSFLEAPDLGFGLVDKRVVLRMNLTCKAQGSCMFHVFPFVLPTC